MPLHTRMKIILLQGLLWLCLLNFGIVHSIIEPGYLDFDNLPDTNFSCVGKVIGGYYADLETSCQMFHVCTIGQLDEPMDIRFLCLNGTVFDQETRVCERVDEVDCTKSEKFYHLNLELYGNTAPPILEEPESTEPPKSSTTTTTTQRPSTTTRTTRTTRATFYTTLPPTLAPTTHATPKVITSNHFPVSGGPDIRFNPEEINIRLTPGSAPIIKAPGVSFQQHAYNGGDSRITVTTHTAVFNDHRSQPLTQKSSASVTTFSTHKPKIEGYHSLNNHKQTYQQPYEYYQQTENSDVDYHTDLPSGEYSYDHYDKEYSKNSNGQQIFSASTTKRTEPSSSSVKPPQGYSYPPRTEKPLSLQIPLPLLPTLPPLTFSSPAPFTLTRHYDAKRSNDHHQLPRIIVSASASVSDASGRRLNYSLGTIGTSHIIPKAPSSYDEYKEDDVGLDPFYHDVPKVKNDRRKRQIEDEDLTGLDLEKMKTNKEETEDNVKEKVEDAEEAENSAKEETSTEQIEQTTHWTPPDYVDDNYEPLTYQISDNNTDNDTNNNTSIDSSNEVTTVPKSEEHEYEYYDYVDDNYEPKVYESPEEIDAINVTDTSDVLTVTTESSTEPVESFTQETTIESNPATESMKNFNIESQPDDIRQKEVDPTRSVDQKTHETDKFYQEDEVPLVNDENLKEKVLQTNEETTFPAQTAVVTEKIESVDSVTASLDLYKTVQNEHNPGTEVTTIPTQTTYAENHDSSGDYFTSAIPTVDLETQSHVQNHNATEAYPPESDLKLITLPTTVYAENSKSTVDETNTSPSLRVETPIQVENRDDKSVDKFESTLLEGTESLSSQPTLETKLDEAALQIEKESDDTVTNQRRRSYISHDTINLETTERNKEYTKNEFIDENIPGTQTTTETLLETTTEVNVTPEKSETTLDNHSKRYPTTTESVTTIERMFSDSDNVKTTTGEETTTESLTTIPEQISTYYENNNINYRRKDRTTTESSSSIIERIDNYPEDTKTTTEPLTTIQEHFSSNTYRGRGRGRGRYRSTTDTIQEQVNSNAEYKRRTYGRRHRTTTESSPTVVEPVDDISSTIEVKTTTESLTTTVERNGNDSETKTTLKETTTEGYFTTVIDNGMDLVEETTNPYLTTAVDDLEATKTTFGGQTTTESFTTVMEQVFNDFEDKQTTLEEATTEMLTSVAPPEIATTVAEVASIQEVATTLPETATTGPEIATTVPEIATTVPEIATTVPEIATTIAEVAPTVAEVTTTIPEVAHTVPEVASTILEAETTVSDIVTTTPPVVVTTPIETITTTEAVTTTEKPTSSTNRYSYLRTREPAYRRHSRTRPTTARHRFSSPAIHMSQSLLRLQGNMRNPIASTTSMTSETETIVTSKDIKAEVKPRTRSRTNNMYRENPLVINRNEDIPVSKERNINSNDESPIIDRTNNFFEESPFTRGKTTFSERNTLIRGPTRHYKENPLIRDDTYHFDETSITDAPLSKSANPTEPKATKSSPLSTTPITKTLFIPRRFTYDVTRSFNCFGKVLNQFYEDPRDCRLFHYCTPGYTDTQVLDMKFVCDYGTYFDPDKLICTKDKPLRCK